MKKIIVFLEVLTFLFCINVDAKCMSDINVIGYTLVPRFDTNTYKYNVYISGNSISIKGTSTNKKSIIEGLGTFDSPNNINDYTIKCDDETYLIRVFKKEEVVEKDNAYLKNISVLGYDINFKKDVFEYDIEKDENKEINVTYELENYKSTLVYNEEDNIIKLEVTSEDKTNTNTYIIKINALENVSNIENNTIKKKELNNYEKSIVIFVLGIVLLTIMCFLKKLIFK